MTLVTDSPTAARRLLVALIRQHLPRALTRRG